MEMKMSKFDYLKYLAIALDAIGKEAKRDYLRMSGWKEHINNYWFNKKDGIEFVKPLDEAYEMAKSENNKKIQNAN